MSDGQRPADPQPGPCGERLYGIPGQLLTCSLRHGHLGDHEDGGTSWRGPRRREALTDDAQPI